MPTSCGRPPFAWAEDSCADVTEMKADPEKCVFRGGCPFEVLLDEPDLADIFAFAKIVTSKTTRKDKHSGVERDEYAISGESWAFACRIKRVAAEKEEEALEWVGVVVKAANDAQVSGLEVARRTSRARQRARAAVKG